MRKVFVLFMVLGVCACVQAAAIQPVEAGGEYSQTTTWVGGVVPTTEDVYNIQTTAALTVSTPGNTCGTMYIGGLNYGVNGDFDTLDVQTGGTLTTTGNVFLSIYAPIPGTLMITGGTLIAGGYTGVQGPGAVGIMTGGQLTTPGLYWAFCSDSSGTMTMSGGNITDNGPFVVGHFHTNVLAERPNGNWLQSGGVTTATGDMMIGTDGGIGYVELTGTAKLTVASLSWETFPWGTTDPGDASMLIEGEGVFTLSAATDASKLESLRIAGEIYTTDVLGLRTWFDAGGAHIAIPEPATMILLGLGGLALLRKRS
jgi:hypothetical protein